MNWYDEDTSEDPAEVDRCKARIVREAILRRDQKSGSVSLDLIYGCDLEPTQGVLLEAVRQLLDEGRVTGTPLRDQADTEFKHMRYRIPREKVGNRTSRV